jgi:hypothetical protein
LLRRLLSWANRGSRVMAERHRSCQKSQQSAVRWPRCPERASESLIVVRHGLPRRLAPWIPAWAISRWTWVSPLPPSGEVAIVCEWPAVEIAVARQRIDAQAIFDAAEKSRSMFGDKLKTAAHRDSRPGPGDASESPLTATMREPMASHYSSVFTEALAQHPRARSRRPFRPRPVAFVASFWRGPLCF